MDIFINGNLRAVESLVDQEIKSFDQYLESLADHFEAVVAAGVVGIKGWGDYGPAPFDRVD